MSVSPIIPGLNDHEIPAILNAAKEAGAVLATYSIVRLPGSVSEVFLHWLEENVSPNAADKIIGRIREIRGRETQRIAPRHPHERRRPHGSPNPIALQSHRPKTRSG